ncbi:response regulator [Paenibacillus campi]|uniref:response regulator n=1 Tax=Paenibacillus campi TaxID=3106031 RepID=UPI002AFDCED6|nr:response regulator [Paenibacillus sp. SGZ-1014]
MYSVIVVDDEPMMLEGWQTMVDWEAYGFKLCGMATDGQEGLELARRLRPELLITDISMPVLDGIGLIKALREEPDVSMRTIIVSGYSEFDYVRQALQCEVDHYLLKPVLGEEMHELLAELKLVLDQSYAEQQRMRRQTEAAAAAAILRLLRAEEAVVPEYIVRLLNMSPTAQVRIVVGAAVEEQEVAQAEAPSVPTHQAGKESIVPLAGEVVPALTIRSDEHHPHYGDNEHEAAMPSSSLHVRRSQRKREATPAIIAAAKRSSQRLSDGTTAIVDVHYKAGEHARIITASVKPKPLAQHTAEIRRYPLDEVEVKSAANRSIGIGHHLDGTKLEPIGHRSGHILHDMENDKSSDQPLRTMVDDLPYAAPMVKLAAACRAAGYTAWTFADRPGHTGLLLITEPCGHTQMASMLETCRQAAISSAEDGEQLATLRLYCSHSANRLDELPGLYARAMELRRCCGSTRSIVIDEEVAGKRAGMAADCRLDEVQQCALHLLQAVQHGNPEEIRTAIEQLPQRWGGQAVPDSMLRVLIRHVLGELLRYAQRHEPNIVLDSADWLHRLLGSQADDPASWSLDTLKRLCLRAAEQCPAKPRSARGTAVSIISEAKRYMQEHYREKLQLQELAQRFNLNAVYFGQQFKRELGCSFNDYVHRLRIEEAQKLLRRTDMKVAEIAAWLGYHDSDYFTNKYKALTGELPSVYKSRKQG